MKKPLPYCPPMDGIPGLMPGNVTPVPEDVDTGPVEHTPTEDELRNISGGSNAVRTLNRRMMKK